MQEKKVKDYQPPYQEEREGLSEEQLEGNPQGWTKEDIEDITNEASNRDANGVLRQTLRGDETKGDPNELSRVRLNTRTPHTDAKKRKTTRKERLT